MRLWRQHRQLVHQEQQRQGEQHPRGERQMRSHGDWQQDERSVKLAGRILIVEDIKLAERDCRKKFGAPLSDND